MHDVDYLKMTLLKRITQLTTRDSLDAMDVIEMMHNWLEYLSRCCMDVIDAVKKRCKLAQHPKGAVGLPQDSSEANWHTINISE